MKKILTCLLVVCIMISGLTLFTGCGQNKVIEVASQQELESALSSTEKTLTIKLTKDISTEKQFVISRKVVLDLNGKTITNDDMTTDLWNNNVGIKTWSLISVQEGGELTIKGNGKLKSKENDCYAVDLRDGAKCTIENGTFVGNITSIYVLEGDLTILGGDFSIQQLSDKKDYRFTLNCLDANYKNKTSKITVKGGTFKEFNPANNLAEGENTNFVAEGYAVKTNSENKPITYTVKKA